MAYQRKDETGKRYGRLLVLKFVDVRHHNARWLCLCDCGRRKVVYGHSLRKPNRGAENGPTRSCGCLARDVTRKRSLKHGHCVNGTRTSLYSIWNGMIERCRNPNCKDYPRYGGRGIKTCKRWLRSFESFVADMGPRPTRLHSIDRYPDNDGDYRPSNCRWATNKQQDRNKSNTIKVTFEGRVLPLIDLCEEKGINYGNVHRRIYKFGWTLKRAISTPIRSKRPNAVRYI